MDTATAEPSVQAVTDRTDTQQYLTFVVADEQYGVDILRVQEIKGYTAVTRIPTMPDYLKGILNLRGVIVPIIDLRLKFRMEPTEPTPFTVIVVVTVGERVIGMIVDAVSDVLELPAKEIQPPPELGGHVDISFVLGIGSANDRLVTLLDLDRVLSGEDVERVVEAVGDRAGE